MLPSAGIKASADWSQNVEAQSPCNPACSLSTLRSLMLYSNAVTDCHARLATGGWLTLARLASHQLDYSPFVWAHNPDFIFSIIPINRRFSLLNYFPVNQNTPFVLAFSIKHFCFTFTIIKTSSVQKRIY